MSYPFRMGIRIKEKPMKSREKTCVIENCGQQTYGKGKYCVDHTAIRRKKSK